jgi:hypothetical protein
VRSPSAGLRKDPQQYRSHARQLVGVRQFRNDQDTVDHALQRGRGRATDALERLQQDAEGLVNDGHRQRFVGVEVVVQSLFWSSSAFDDVAEAGAAATTIVDQFDRGVDDLASSHLRAAVPRHGRPFGPFDTRATGETPD